MKRIKILGLLLGGFLYFIPQVEAQNQDVFSKYQDLNPALHPNGKGWQFHVDKREAGKKKKVLLIGDSVLNGYLGLVIKSLGEGVLVDFWTTPLYESQPQLFPLLNQVSSFREYDVIHFNIGLHGWGEGRVNEKEYPSLMKKYVEVLRKNNPEAVLIWATSTPILTKNDTVPDPKLNPIIARRNKKANKIMKSKKVLINDLYELSIDSCLGYSKRDGFHWGREAQKIQANQVTEIIKNNLNPSNKTK